MLRAIVACGWFGIQTWIGGTALDALFGMMWPGWRTSRAAPGARRCAAHVARLLLLLGGYRSSSSSRGIEGIKHLETWAAPLLLVGGAALLVVGRVARGRTRPRARRESDALSKQRNDFWTIFPGALTASVGYWATLSLNIPDFTRYARSQRSQMLGQALGLPLTMTAFAFIGVAVTSATLIIYGRAIPDPVELMEQFDSVAVILFATVVIFAAQLTTNMAANVVSPSNDFSNLNPKLISYVTGGLITAVIGIVMMPWKLMASVGDYIFTWLIGYSGLMGAIAGIMICDYWVLRRQAARPRRAVRPGRPLRLLGRLQLARDRRARRGGRARRARLPARGDDAGGQVAHPAFFDTLYTYAWFVTFALGFVVYYVLMRGHAGLREG